MFRFVLARVTNPVSRGLESRVSTAGFSASAKKDGETVNIEWNLIEDPESPFVSPTVLPFPDVGDIKTPAVEHTPWQPSDQEIFRFKTRRFIYPKGRFEHPAKKKVVMEVFVKDLKLGEERAEYLKMLCGHRYNPHRDEITITSERQQDASANAHDCIDTLNRAMNQVYKVFPENP